MDRTASMDMEREIDRLAAKFDAAWTSDNPLQIDEAMAEAARC